MYGQQPMYGQATTSFFISLPVSPMIVMQGNKIKNAKIFKKGLDAIIVNSNKQSLEIVL